jgi:two-component system response regulator PilR (NtrC family)
MIHEQGPRAASAFVPVNCGAIPQELMESELFGHKKGSFTGAVSDKLGLFQSAEQGTLFLDEVAELPVHMQVKLLRAIQEKSVRPVGAEREVPVDVRILSATHQDLAELVERGTFRQDLFYRVNVIQLQVPPLRKRPGDIPLLADHILHRLAGQIGVEIPEISPASLAVLKAYKFPGNVRELENVLERAMTLCEGSTIEEVNLGLSAPNPADDAEFGVNSDDLNTLLVSVEKEKILRALEETRWNKTAAAKFLGISFGALRYRMQKLGLE